MSEAPEIRFYRSSGPFGFLSNLYPCKVLFEGIEFTSAERAYQFGKPRSPKVAEWIAQAPTERMVALAAHSLLPYDVVDGWNDIKSDRMLRVLQAKFNSNYALRNKLLDTGNAILIEASKTDSFWGAGRKGDGKNELGRLLMRVREGLRYRTGSLGGGDNAGILPAEKRDDIR